MRRGFFCVFAQTVHMKLSCMLCSFVLIALGICGGVYALTGFDLLLFLCLGSPAAARAAMGAGGVCGLFSAYAAAALKPYSRLR